MGWGEGEPAAVTAGVVPGNNIIMGVLGATWKVAGGVVAAGRRGCGEMLFARRGARGEVACWRG